VKIMLRTIISLLINCAHLTLIVSTNGLEDLGDENIALGPHHGYSIMVTAVLGKWPQFWPNARLIVNLADRGAAHDSSSADYCTLHVHSHLARSILKLKIRLSRPK